jgi:hypothetical protein
MYGVMALSVVVLLFGANLTGRLPANALGQSGPHQAAIMVDQLTANAKDLPVQSFDAF